MLETLTNARAAHPILVLCSTLMWFTWAPASRALAAGGESTCGTLENAYGPYDFRTDKQKLVIVERHHFTPEVEGLIRGKSGRLGGDLDYTLRASPNHHRALLAVIRYGETRKSAQPADLPRPVECYLERALRFRSEDNVTRMIYAKFLASKGRAEEAARHLEAAASLAKDNPLSHYNIGLLYFELKDYQKALSQAHKAIALGMPAPALREQLMSVGQWAEPSGTSMPAASQPGS